MDRTHAACEHASDKCLLQNSSVARTGSAPASREQNRFHPHQLSDPGPPDTLQWFNDDFHSLSGGTSGHLVPDLPFGVDIDNAEMASFEPEFVNDFMTFMDSVPNLDNPFNPAYQPLPVFFSDLSAASTAPSDNIAEAASGCLQLVETGAGPAPDSTVVRRVMDRGRAGDRSLSTYGSRLPSLEPDEMMPTRSPHPQGPNGADTRRLFISPEHRKHIISAMAHYSGFIDDNFILPSRYVLSRFVVRYFTNFHDHYPMFHLPTLDLEKMNFDLVLAIAALGARYAREPEVGVALYHVSKAVVLERTNRYRNERASWTMGGRSNDAPLGEDGGSRPPQPKFSIWNAPESALEIKQTLILLIAISSWYSHEPSASDALSIRSVLHALTIEGKKMAVPEQPTDVWERWIQAEVLKRTRLVTFCIFNIHTICFDLPPMMLAQEVRVELPDSEREWKLNETQWREAHLMPKAPRHSFQDALSGLYATSDALPAAETSALGGCALMHALIQQIWLVRNARLPNRELAGSLPDEEMGIIERALKRWTKRWEANQESSMNPLNPYGPLTFTSTALLRLAYIRIHLDVGPVRSLGSWDATTVALSLHRSPRLQRSDKVTRAALHCAHALSIPVKLGIAYIAQTQLIYWSNQHALCSLECALLSAKWLEVVSCTNPVPPLTDAEQRVLNFMVQLIAETEYRVSCKQIMDQKHQMSSMTVRLWAKLYQENSVWQMVTLIGQALSIYADLLKADSTDQVSYSGHGADPR